MVHKWLGKWNTGKTPYRMNPEQKNSLSVINSSLPKVEVAIMKQGYMWICALSQPYSVFPFSDLDKQNRLTHR